MRAPRSKSLRPVPVVTRCAIYTRQSVEERNKNGFGSLEAQREACEKYVSLFQEKGWQIFRDPYQDAGFSGGTLDRPALKRLRADVAARKIESVVVYRSDRLSRSIRDFLELMEEFERHGVAFASVSEQFDTSTPAGRMQRNMLLTFAQYERELIAERTRDKVHAARRKGKFTGGMLVLGYDRDPKGGRLVVNEAEADRVREIFRLFAENPSLVALGQELSRRDWTLKRWKTKEGKWTGGGIFDKFSLKRLLTNPVYLGEVHFQGEVYTAEHEAIVDREMWDRVQELLAPTPDRPRTRSSKSTALLAGVLRCAPCDSAMTPTYSQKGRIRYRYYLCLKAHRRGWDSCPSKSVSAREIEKFIVDHIRAIGRDPDLVARTVKEAEKILATRKAELGGEARGIRKELDQAHASLRSRMATVSGDGKTPRRDQGAATEETIRDLEDRLAAVEEELDGLDKLQINPDNLCAALAAFDPVWEQLTSAEQARIIQLLIDRIDYDGGTGNLDITFRPSGVRTLVENGKSPEGAGA